ncbi:MAG: hypothetical protein BroJett022_21320 [Actinomycetes bacterium]|nr:MAG: hypothetical protein BroJett022_21320 [Actinomycetes bacterium]
MTVVEVARRLRAWEAGRPVERYSTLHHAVARPGETLIVAFVRMAGESRPWGIAWGHPEDEPVIASVPDGRIRDDVAEIAVEFGEALLEHLRVENWTINPLYQDADPSDLRQVWVPNGQHVAMFHQLDYAYSQTTFGGANVDLLNALGRLAGWLFRDSNRSGSQHVIDASKALREAYAFPAQDARQAHLGYLLGWLLTDGDRPTRMAAAEVAEAFPVSPTMDPNLERDELDGPLAKRRDLLREGADVDSVEAEIAAVLIAELKRRWRLCEQAYDVLANSDRPTNPGVDELVRVALGEFYWQCQARELKRSDQTTGPPFIPHPETDHHGSAAASRYLFHCASDEAYINCLIHDDDVLFEEAIGDGRAIHGRVLAVTDEGEGRSTRPVWTIELASDTLHRIREGGRIVPRGSAGHWAAVRTIERDGQLQIVIEWSGRKTKPLATGIGGKPADETWVGESIAFVADDAAELTRRRSHRVWKAKDGPGGWLTHGRSGVQILADIANDTPDEIVDDVVQIEDEPR